MNAGALSSRQSWMLGDSYGPDLWSFDRFDGHVCIRPTVVPDKELQHQTTTRHSEKRCFFCLMQQE
jgi:hypothetical protein